MVTSAAFSRRATALDFEDFYENGGIALHLVASDGDPARNKAELDLLGYSAEEYIGRYIAEFHCDRGIIEDILARLKRREALRNYPVIADDRNLVALLTLP
jgi:hypothetical protein